MAEDPYTSPDSDPSQLPNAEVKKPTVMLVFGIIHVILAAVGLIGLVISFAVSSDPKQQILDSFDQPGQPPVVISSEALAALDDAMKFQSPMMIAQTIICALILVAGIGLLKSTTWSVKTSTWYSLVSIFTKITILILAFTYLSPAYQRFFEGITGGEEVFLKIMKGAIISSLFLPALYLIYPVLSLILLKKQSVRDYLAAR